MRNKKKIQINDIDDDIKVYVSPITEDELIDIRSQAKRYICAGDKDKKTTISTEFERKYGIKLTNIIAQGSPYSKSSDVFKNNIPSTLIKEDHVNMVGKHIKVFKKAYRCVAQRTNLKDQIHNPKTAGLILHEDLKSSVNCMLNCLGKPKFVIIYKIEKK